MEIPDLVRNALGGEEIQAGVNLGDEDTVCLTPTRTLLYRAEGLLSDEKVEEYPHDVERLSVNEGRRKTKFVLDYVGETRTFTVPNGRTEQVLQLLMEGILTVDDVIGADESVTGVFLFSELALFVTEARVVKHIGSAVWSEDYEEYPYDDLTGLSFEQGSVATEVILEIDGRPQRIKTPTEQAREVQREIETAVFGYYGVESLDALNATIATADADADTETDGTDGEGSQPRDIGIGEGIDPLGAGDTTESRDDSGVQTPEIDTAVTEDSGESESSVPTDTDSGRPETAPTDGAPGDEPSPDIEEVHEQLAELTTAVQQQNDLLRKQHGTIKQLIQELRDGRG